MTSHPDTPRALIGWRLLALLYDFFPALALWMVAGAIFTVGYQLAGHGAREYIAPFSALQWLLWLVCWLLTGTYAIASWRRGGQTLGMRPWRLKVLRADGRPAGTKALLVRYAVATLSLAAGGLGLLWTFVDRERRAWHDLASGTVLVRLDAPPR